MRSVEESIPGGVTLTIEDARQKLRAAMSTVRDITFVRGFGNIGDDLIYAGARALLSYMQYSEISIRDLEGVEGELAVISGSGGWCGPYHAMPKYLAQVEARFDRVIVLPSSFDPAVEPVRRALERTKALVFARELVSFQKIRNLCDCDIAHDTALYFDYSPYKRDGKGTLTAYRTDLEAVADRALPVGNNDISVACESLDEFLWTIARNELIRTDRAHVTIAGAMLGKRVEYASSNYHKVPAIVEFSLKGLAVERVEPETRQTVADSLVTKRMEQRAQNWQSHAAWIRQLERAREELSCLVPQRATFILADENQWGREPSAPGRVVLPFVERNGEYWGPPEDDDSGIAELERLRAVGAEFMVFAWPAFWLLHHYTGLVAHLERKYRRTWTGDRLIVFDLRSQKN